LDIDGSLASVFIDVGRYMSVAIVVLLLPFSSLTEI
jgi:hypothetical protein